MNLNEPVGMGTVPLIRLWTRRLKAVDKGGSVWTSV
jgi:hypothetical protein